MRERATAGGPAWSILRPDVVIGDVFGNAMNIVMVIGVYAAICRATGIPFRFPSKPGVYDGVLHQVTDTLARAHASLWAATEDRATGRTFNDIHKPFRLERVWRKVGAALGLAVEPPVRLRRVEQMADKGPLWQRISAEHSRVEVADDRLVVWDFGDGVWGSDFDMIADMGKIRCAGFTLQVDPVEAILGALASLSGQRTLPFLDLAERRAGTGAVPA